MNKDITIKTLQESPEYFDQVLQIIEDEFHYKEENQYQIDFYSMMNKKNHQNCYVLFLHGECIGHIGLKPRILCHKNIQTPVCLIGGIAIKKTAQGKGLFKIFFQKVLDDIKNKYSLLFLWGNLDDLYSKFGFYQCGETFQIEGKPFSRDNFIDKNFSLIDKNNISSQDLEILKKSYQKYFVSNCCTIWRSDEDWENIMQTASMDLYLNRNTEDYFLANKGQDLIGVIHESTTEVHGYKLWCPTFHRNNKEFTSIYTAMTKIGNLQLLKDFSFMINKNATINFNNWEPQQILTSLFGPQEEPYLPCLFITGADSV